MWQNAHYKLGYNIGNEFDGGACDYKKLPTAARDSLLSKPEELVGRLAIRKATAVVVSFVCQNSD